MTDNFDAFREIVAAGIDIGEDPPLLPTSIIKTPSDVAIQALDPAPEYSDVHDTARQWMQQLETAEEVTASCLAFSTSLDEVLLEWKQSNIEEQWLGTIDRDAPSIEWTRLPIDS